MSLFTAVFNSQLSDNPEVSMSVFCLTKFFPSTTIKRKPQTNPNQRKKKTTQQKQNEQSNKTPKKNPMTQKLKKKKEKKSKLSQK